MKFNGTFENDAIAHDALYMDHILRAWADYNASFVKDYDYAHRVRWECYARTRTLQMHLQAYGRAGAWEQLPATVHVNTFRVLRILEAVSGFRRENDV